LADLRGEIRDLLLQCIFFLRSHALKRRVNLPEKLLGHKSFYFVPFEMEQTVQAEIQVGQFKLEEVSEQILELAQSRHTLFPLPAKF
jgi:hypothetical protein